MVKFLHHLFNPHCPDCKIERLEKATCPSCETLHGEIERLRAENNRLLDVIINPKIEVEKVIDINELKPIAPRHVPLSVRREQFEAADRLKAAQLRRDAIQPDVKEELKDLEKELDDVRQERETKTG